MQKKQGLKFKRRKFLHYGVLGAATVMAWPFISACNSNSVNSGDQAAATSFEPDLEFELTAVEKNMSIFPGTPTSVMVFESKLIKGDSGSLTQIDESYLGPTIHVSRGQKVRILFINRLSEESIIHWHGMHVPEQYDGHPKNVIASGETYIYEYEIMNKAGTYWYHPHPHRRTGHQVYNGLAGMLIVTDEAELALDLPVGKFDLPIVIQDKSFDDDNQLVYLKNGHMRNSNGFLGDQIFINGNAAQNISVQQGVYRLRLLNGSNSRYYKLGWEDGTPITVIGTDGSLLARPRDVPYIMIGSGERLDLWLDLSIHAVGTEMILNSLSFFNGADGEMGGGMMNNMGEGMMRGGQKEIPLGSEYLIVKLKIDKPGGNKYTLPERLINLDKLEIKDALNTDEPRSFKFAGSMMRWTINGRTFKTEEVTDYETVKLNTTEVWEFVHGGHGMMGKNNVPHPIHIHQVQFNIIERNIDNMDAGVWENIKDGFIDEGWKDTFLLMPGMIVKVLIAFKSFKGIFLYHCHNLEHEDMGMMRNFAIT
ncbi:MAG: multicopper oxidase family protein [Bacteroidota bacterium]